MKEKIEYRGFSVEFRAMLSNEPSYFSLKRWERFEAYHAAILLHIAYIIWNFSTLAPLEFLMLVAPLYLIAGYSMNKTEKAKPKPTDENGNPI